jgi:hypothetical protein
MLAAAAIAVLGMGVYLFIQVRATPAQAGATYGATTTTQNPPRENQVAEVTPKDLVKEPAPPVPGSTHTSWERPPSMVGAANDSDDRKVDLKVDNLMELANTAYDAQDFDQAVAIAGKVLAKEPTNVRMLRVMVSANCIQGDSVIAQQHYEKLPPFDREQMKQRCDRYGVLFKDPP